MAGNIQYKIQIQADASQAQRSVEQLDATLSRLRNVSQQQIHLNLDYRDAAQQAEKLQAALQKAVQVDTGKLDFRALTQGLQGANTNVQTLMNSFSKAGQAGQAAMQQLNQALTQATVPAQKATGIMAKFGTTLMNTFKWQIASNMVHGLQSAITNAVSYVENLNTSLTNIRVVTGKSIEDMTKFATQANKMARTLSTSTKAYADAALIYYQQGDTDKLAQQKANITLKASNVAFKANAREMSEMLTAVWNSYKVGDTQLEQYVDVMAKLGATTATSMEEIATSLQKVAATASTVGVSMEQMSSIVATVSSVTRESAEHIGTSFKTILARMGDLKLGQTLEDGVGLGTVSSTLNKVGVAVLDATGNMRDMGDVITDLGNKWQTMSKAQKTAVAEVVAGKRQYTQLMALFENWDEYQKDLANTKTSAGSLQKMQSTYETSIKAAKQRLQASKENLWSSLVDDQAIVKFNDSLSKTLDVVTNIVKGLGGLPGILAGVGSAMMTAFQPQLLDKMTHAFTAIGTMPKRAIAAFSGAGSYGSYNKSFQSAGILNANTVALGDKMAGARFSGLQSQLYNNLISARGYIQKDMNATLMRGGVIARNASTGYYENRMEHGQPLNVRPVTGENLSDAVAQGKMSAADMAHYQSQQNALYANNLKQASMLQQGKLSVSQQAALENMQQQYAQRSADFFNLQQSMQATERATRTTTSAANLTDQMRQQGWGTGPLTRAQWDQIARETSAGFVGPYKFGGTGTPGAKDYVRGAKDYFRDYNAQTTDAGRGAALTRLGQDVVKSTMEESVNRSAAGVLQTGDFTKVQTAEDLTKLMNKEFSPESGTMAAKTLFGADWAERVGKATTPQEVQDLVKGFQQQVTDRADQINANGAGARTAAHILFGERGLEQLQNQGRDQAANTAEGRNLNSQELPTELPKATAAEKLAVGVKNVGQAALKAAQGLSQMKNIFQAFEDGDTSAQITSIATAAGSLINTFATQGLWAGIGQVAGMGVQAVISVIQGKQKALREAQEQAAEQADELVKKTKEQNNSLKNNYQKWQELNEQYESGKITYSDYQSAITDVCTALGMEDSQIQTLIGSYEALNTAIETNLQLKADQAASDAKVASTAYQSSLSGRVSKYGSTKNIGEISMKTWRNRDSDWHNNWNGEAIMGTYYTGRTADMYNSMGASGNSSDVILLADVISHSQNAAGLTTSKEKALAILSVLGASENNANISGGNIAFTGLSDTFGYQFNDSNSHLYLGNDMDSLLDMYERLSSLYAGMTYDAFTEKFGYTSQSNFDYMLNWIQTGTGKEVFDFLRQMTEGYADVKDVEEYTAGRSKVLGKRAEYKAKLGQSETAYEDILRDIIQEIYGGAKDITDSEARRVGEQLMNELFTGMDSAATALYNSSKQRFGITEKIVKGIVGVNGTATAQDYERANNIIRLSGLSDEDLLYTDSSMIDFSGSDEDIAASLSNVTQWRQARTKATTRVTLRDDAMRQEANGTLDVTDWLTKNIGSLLTGEALEEANNILTYGSAADKAALYSRLMSGDLSLGTISQYAGRANSYVESGVFSNQGRRAALSNFNGATGAGWDMFNENNVEQLTSFFLALNTIWSTLSELASDENRMLQESDVVSLVSQLKPYFEGEALAAYLANFGITYDPNTGLITGIPENLSAADFRSNLMNSNQTMTYSFTNAAGETEHHNINPFGSMYTTYDGGSGILGTQGSTLLTGSKQTLMAYGATGLTTSTTNKTEQQQQLEARATARNNMNALANVKTDVMSWDENDIVQYTKLFHRSYAELLGMSVSEINELALEAMEREYQDMKANGASADELALANAQIKQTRKTVAETIEAKNAAALTDQENEWNKITTAASNAESALQGFMQSADQPMSFSAIETLRQNLIDAGMAAEQVQKIIDDLTSDKNTTAEKIEAAAKAAGNAALAKITAAEQQQTLYDLSGETSPVASKISQTTEEAPPITSTLTVTDIIWGDQSILDRVFEVNGEVVFQNKDGTLSTLENFHNDGVEIYYWFSPKDAPAGTGNRLAIDQLWTGATPLEGGGYEYHLYYSMEPLKDGEEVVPSQLLDLTSQLPDADDDGKIKFDLAFTMSEAPSEEQLNAMTQINSTMGGIGDKDVTQTYTAQITLTGDSIDDFTKAKNLFDAFQNDSAETFTDMDGNPLGFSFSMKVDGKDGKTVMDIWNYAHTLKENAHQFSDIPLTFSVKVQASKENGDQTWYNLLTGVELGEADKPKTAGTLYIDVQPAPESASYGKLSSMLEDTGATPVATKTVEIHLAFDSEESAQVYEDLYGESAATFGEHDMNPEEWEAQEAQRQKELHDKLVAQHYEEERKAAEEEAARQQRLAEERQRRSEEAAAREAEMQATDGAAISELNDWNEYWTDLEEGNYGQAFPSIYKPTSITETTGYEKITAVGNLGDLLHNISDKEDFAYWLIQHPEAARSIFTDDILASAPKDYKPYIEAIRNQGYSQNGSGAILDKNTMAAALLFMANPQEYSSPTFGVRGLPTLNRYGAGDRISDEQYGFASSLRLPSTPLAYNVPGYGEIGYNPNLYQREWITEDKEVSFDPETATDFFKEIIDPEGAMHITRAGTWKTSNDHQEELATLAELKEQMLSVDDADAAAELSTNIQDLFNTALEYLQSEDAELQQIGLYLIQGLAEGITASSSEAQSLIVAAIAPLGDVVLEAFCAALGIASPSRLTKGLGIYLLQGLQLGLTENIGTFKPDLGNLSGIIYNSLTKEIDQALKDTNSTMSLKKLDLSHLGVTLDPATLMSEAGWTHLDTAYQDALIARYGDFALQTKSNIPMTEEDWWAQYRAVYGDDNLGPGMDAFKSSWKEQQVQLSVDELTEQWMTDHEAQLKQQYLATWMQQHGLTATDSRDRATAEHYAFEGSQYDDWMAEQKAQVHYDLEATRAIQTGTWTSLFEQVTAENLELTKQWMMDGYRNSEALSTDLAQATFEKIRQSILAKHGYTSIDQVTSAEEMTQIISEISSEYDTQWNNIQNTIQSEIATLKDTWQNAISSLAEIDETEAQRVYDVWVNTFTAIAAARKAILGDSIIGDEITDLEQLASIIAQLSAQGMGKDEIFSFLTTKQGKEGINSLWQLENSDAWKHTKDYDYFFNSDGTRKENVSYEGEGGYVAWHQAKYDEYKTAPKEWLRDYYESGTGLEHYQAMLEMMGLDSDQFSAKENGIYNKETNSIISIDELLEMEDVLTTLNDIVDRAERATRWDRATYNTQENLALAHEVSSYSERKQSEAEVMEAELKTYKGDLDKINDARKKGAANLSAEEQDEIQKIFDKWGITGDITDDNLRAAGTQLATTLTQIATQLKAILGMILNGEADGWRIDTKTGMAIATKTSKFTGFSDQGTAMQMLKHTGNGATETGYGKLNGETYVAGNTQRWLDAGYSMQKVDTTNWTNDDWTAYKSSLTSQVFQMAQAAGRSDYTREMAAAEVETMIANGIYTAVHRDDVQTEFSHMVNDTVLDGYTHAAQTQEELLASEAMERAGYKTAKELEQAVMSKAGFFNNDLQLSHEDFDSAGEQELWANVMADNADQAAALKGLKGATSSTFKELKKGTLSGEEEFGHYDELAGYANKFFNTDLADASWAQANLADLEEWAKGGEGALAAMERLEDSLLTEKIDDITSGLENASEAASDLNEQMQKFDTMAEGLDFGDDITQDMIDILNGLAEAYDLSADDLRILGRILGVELDIEEGVDHIADDSTTVDEYIKAIGSDLNNSAQKANAFLKIMKDGNATVEQMREAFGELKKDPEALANALGAMDTSQVQNLVDTIGQDLTLHPEIIPDFDPAAFANMDLEAQIHYLADLGALDGLDLDQSGQITYTSDVSGAELTVTPEPVNGFVASADAGTYSYTLPGGGGGSGNWSWANFGAITGSIPVIEGGGGSGGGQNGAKVTGGKKTRTDSTPSKGGGGGGGGGKKAQKKKSYGDIERYHEVNKEIDHYDKSVAKLEAKESMAFGSDRVKLMAKRMKELNKQMDAYQEKLNEAAAYEKKDKANLEKAAAELGFKFEYDENGVITNWEKWQEKLIDWYNAHKDDEAEDGMESPEDVYKRLQKLSEDYEDSVSTREEMEQKILEMLHEQSELYAEMLETAHQWKIDLHDLKLDMLEGQLSRMDDTLGNMGDKAKLMGEALFGADGVGLDGTSMDKLNELLALQNEIASAKTDQESIRNGEGMDEATKAEKLQEVMGKVNEQMNDLWQKGQQIQELYGQMWEKYDQELQTNAKLIENNIKAMQSFVKILELAGRQNDFDTLDQYYRKQLDFANKSVDLYMATRDTLAAEKERFDQEIKDAGGFDALDEQRQKDYKDLIARIQETDANLMSATEDVLEAAAQVYQNAVNKSIKKLDETLAMGMGDMEYLQQQYDRYTETQDRYLNTAHQLYNVNKLNRQIEGAMADTNNKALRDQYEALQNVINEKAKSGKLTQYDVDMMQKQYELLEKQAALKDAQNAKDTVRLTRDENGNYMYQYTADQDKIDEATQAYDDVLIQINELSTQRVSELESEMLEKRKWYVEQARAIAEDETLTEEQKQERLTELRRQAAEDDLYFQEQMGIAYENLQTNNSACVAAFGDAVDQAFNDPSEGINPTIQAAIENEENMADALGEAIDAIIPKLQELGRIQDQTLNRTGLEDPSEYFDSMAEETKLAMTETTKLNEKLADQAEKINAVTQEWYKQKEVLKDLFATIEAANTENLQLLWQLGNNDTDIADPSSTGTIQYRLVPVKNSSAHSTDGHAKGGLVDYTGYHWLDGSITQPELVLSATDTANMLQTVDMLHNIDVTSVQNLLALLSGLAAAMSGGGISAGATNIFSGSGALEQDVHITAEFPNATDKAEIMAAFDELNNRASQYANRNRK